MTDFMKEMCYLVAASTIATVGACEDLRSRRIPNILTGCSLVCGLTLHLALGGPSELGFSALAGLGGATLLLVMYVAGGMGAGDVKLMAAVGCLAGCSSLRLILTGTFLSGAIFGIALALYDRRLRDTVGNALLLVGHPRWVEGSSSDPLGPGGEATGRAQRLSIPYAVPIAAGCLISLGTLVWKG